MPGTHVDILEKGVVLANAACDAGTERWCGGRRTDVGARETWAGGRERQEGVRAGILSAAMQAALEAS